MLGYSPVVCSTLTIALLVSGCAKQPAAVSDSPGSVTITVGTLQLRSADAAYVDAIIPLVVTNASADPVFFNECAPTLERSVNGSWQAVFALTCPLDTSVKDIRIPGGTQRTVEFPVRAALGYGSGYRWSLPLEGEYRLRTSLRNDREVLPDAVGVTRSFRLPSR
jgi:hypothetical protein